MRQNFILQLRCAQQGPAVEFQHLLRLQGVFGGIKIAGIGQQKAQGVADAAVGIDHARQDFVVYA